MSYMDRYGQSQPTPASPMATSPSTSIATTASTVRNDIVNRATQFYRDHPTLVKVLGTIAVAQLARSLTRR